MRERESGNVGWGIQSEWRRTEMRIMSPGVGCGTGRLIGQAKIDNIKEMTS